jgi:hypothetical protein
MKKYLTLGIATAMSLAFAACSSEDLVEPVQQQEVKGSDTYVQLSFAMSASATSRATEYDPSGAESSGTYIQGNANEYNIKKVYLYFFEKKSDGSYEPVSISETAGREHCAEYTINKSDLTTSTAEADNTSGTGTTAATGSAGKAVVYTTAELELPAKIEVGNTYHVYALINKPLASTATYSNENEFLETELDVEDDSDIESEISTETGYKKIKDLTLPMASRSYNGTTYATLVPQASNTKTNPAHLTFDIERSYARIAFLNTTNTFPLWLTNATEEKTTIGSVELLGYQIVNRSKKFYTFRHVGSISSEYKVTKGGFGPISSTSQYVIDPNTESKKENSYCTDFFNRLKEAKAITNYENVSSWYNFSTLTGFTRLNPATDASTPNSIEYVAENTMGQKAQIKTQTTGVIFAARITPADGYLVKADGESWSVGQDLYYVGGKFYTSIAALQTFNSGITKKNYNTYGVKFFKNGLGYYEYYIRHFSNDDDSVMGIMEFGIVRNNSYELTINGISMSPYSGLPGNPGDIDPDGPDPDPEVIPDPDDPDESQNIYIDMKVNVRPWIVRTISVNLGH